MPRHAILLRFNVTLDGETAQQLFFGGKLEIEEVFVHAADFETARQRLLQTGVRTYPGPVNPTRLAASLREASPSPPARVGQMQMTAWIGGAIAAQALGILPPVRAALGQGKEPTYTSLHGNLWGSVDLDDPALGTTGTLHLPLGTDDPNRPGADVPGFELCLAQLEATLRDHLQLHQWVQQTLSRFATRVLAPKRFGRFLDVTALPAAAFTNGYRPLAPGHFEERFEVNGHEFRPRTVRGARTRRCDRRSDSSIAHPRRRRTARMLKSRGSAAPGSAPHRPA